MGDAGEVVEGMVADLLMESGRVYRCAWRYQGRICAWWPLTGNRKAPIALFEPKAWRPIKRVVALSLLARSHQCQK
jgi:hypothetical protein